MNKILKAFQTNVFVCVIFLYKKTLILNEKHLIYLLFFLDLVTLAISTDNVEISQDFSARSQIGKIIVMCSTLGMISMFEFIIIYEAAFELLDFSQQQTAAFEMLFFFGILNVLCFRVKGAWWSSKPGRDLILAILFDILFLFILVHSSMFDIQPIDYTVSLCIFMYFLLHLTFSYSFCCSLILNDLIKIVLTWLLDLKL